ncbi:hypothetical protein TWF694_011076 [Orbilia ellipsospora]|uniref:MYND-type domain-containing protein n=1 Tax=Orbilia ellipsospora TaxID=2528407 RepID=A0AAV9X7Y5_9PEZI
MDWEKRLAKNHLDKRIDWEYTPELVSKYCAVCATAKKPIKRCGRCKEEYYCSKECQKIDWKNHKPVCGKPYTLGIVIHCFGDRQVYGKPHYQPVKVTLTNVIFSDPDTCDTSDIADRIGIPIFTAKLPLNPEWMDVEQAGIFKHSHPHDNQDATYLHICCDPKVQWDVQSGDIGWAWCGMRWQRHVGSVLVVRQDKKPLTRLHMEILTSYCRFYCQPLFAHSIGEDYPRPLKPMSKYEVLRRISRESFLLHWHRLLEDFEIPNPKSIATPYDV